MNAISLITVLETIVVAMPVVLLCVLGVSSLFDRKLSEQATSRWCEGAMVTALLAAIGVESTVTRTADRLRRRP